MLFDIHPVPNDQRITCTPQLIYSLIWTALAESSPGRQSRTSPEGAENIPEHFLCVLAKKTPCTAENYLPDHSPNCPAISRREHRGFASFPDNVVRLCS
jgi:hypothetical protein